LNFIFDFLLWAVSNIFFSPCKFLIFVLVTEEVSEKKGKREVWENMDFIIVVFVLDSGSVGWTFWFSQSSF
jgi:hypothetical protein